MPERTIDPAQLASYTAHLRREERSPGTIEKYLRDIRAFAGWLDGRPVSRELVAEWRDHLLSKDYAPVTINSMLAALNGLFHFLGWDECRAKFLKVQRRLFRDAGRELTRQEYERLLAAARARGQERLALLMEAICATGCPRCGISPWRPPSGVGPRSPSREKFAPFCCRASFAANC